MNSAGCFKLAHRLNKLNTWQPLLRKSLQIAGNPSPDIERELKQWTQCKKDPLRSLFSLMISADTTFFNVRNNSGNA